MNKSIDIADYKVLLVDDDFAYTTGQEVVLSSKGINIKTMNNPVEALEHLKTNFYDVILLDFFMPEMTGEEFLAKLREFNIDSIIILQTGYSGEKPQDEMLYQLNIQGYYNKAKPNEDLMLMVLSAIKSAQLLREIKKREEEKQLSKMKDAYFAELIDAVSGEINEKLMGIGGPTMVLESLINEGSIIDSEKNDFLVRLGYIKDAASQIKEAMKALNISSEKELIPHNLLGKIQILMRAYMIKNGSKLTVNASEDFVIINICDGNIPYIICRDIEERAKNSGKEIKLSSYKEGDKIIIEITSNSALTDKVREELKKMETMCDNLELVLDENMTKLIIDKEEK